MSLIVRSFRDGPFAVSAACGAGVGPRACASALGGMQPGDAGGGARSRSRSRTREILVNWHVDKVVYVI